jgi:hypothetical protein
VGVGREPVVRRERGPAVFRKKTGWCPGKALALMFASNGTEVLDLPYVFRPKQLRRSLAAALGAAAVTLAAVPAAEAACTATPTTKAFAAFGDNADYSLATGWSLTGSSVANGNSSAKVHGAADAKSLAISATGKAASPSFCVGIQHPSFRFFARRTSGTWGVLNVKLRYTNADGVTNETTVGSVSAGDTAWHPTASIALSGVLGLWNGDQSASVQIVLDPEDYGGAWAVDDVYIDPYSRT